MASTAWPLPSFTDIHSVHCFKVTPIQIASKFHTKTGRPCANMSRKPPSRDTVGTRIPNVLGLNPKANFPHNPHHKLTEHLGNSVFDFNCIARFRKIPVYTVHYLLINHGKVSRVLWMTLCNRERFLANFSTWIQWKLVKAGNCKSFFGNEGKNVKLFYHKY